MEGAEGATGTHTRESLIKLEVSGKATQNKLHLSNKPNTCGLNIKWQCSNLSECAHSFKHSPQQKSSLNSLHIVTYSSLILFWVKLTVHMSTECLIWEIISFPCYMEISTWVWVSTKGQEQVMLHGYLYKLYPCIVYWEWGPLFMLNITFGSKYLKFVNIVTFQSEPEII